MWGVLPRVGYFIGFLPLGGWCSEVILLASKNDIIRISKYEEKVD
jgi:hypothetical protein